MDPCPARVRATENGDSPVEVGRRGIAGHSEEETMAVPVNGGGARGQGGPGHDPRGCRGDVDVV
jgi:hypothetical protein